MSDNSEVSTLKGRIAALELIIVTHMLLDELKKPDFNPVEFAAHRKAYWKQMGQALGDDWELADAFQTSTERLGALIMHLAKPLDEAVKAKDNPPG